VKTFALQYTTVSAIRKVNITRNIMKYKFWEPSF